MRRWKTSEAARKSADIRSSWWRFVDEAGTWLFF
jgi:hypothetical protein